MKNGWEPGGPLIDALAALSAAIKIGPATGQDSIAREFRALNAWDLVQEAHRKLDAARLRAIKEEASPYLDIAVRNARAQAAAVTGPRGDGLRESDNWESFITVSDAELEADGVEPPITLGKVIEYLERGPR